MFYPGLNWWEMLGSMTAVVTAIVALATVYLRYFVRSETTEMRDSILEKIDDNFARKSDLEDIRRRLDRLEERDSR